MSDEITDAFEAGIRRGVNANMLEAPFAHDRGKQMVREASAPEDYLAAAEQLGFAYRFAQKHNFVGEQSDILDVLGSIYARHPSIDSDEAKVRASKAMRRAARGFVSIGEMRRAAIPLTNAAVSLLEKSDISGAEFSMIKRFLDFGFQHKLPDTVDWGYSEGALGMYYSRLPAISKSERIANLQKSKEANERALAIFAEHDEIVPVGSQAIMSEVERHLYRERRAQKVADAILEHVSELPAPIQDIASNFPNMLANTIRSNPAAHGFEVVPEWLSGAIESAPTDEEVATLRAARNRAINAAESASGSDYIGILDCRWQAAEIGVDLLPADEAYNHILDVITTYADEFTPEEFIRRGSRVIGLAHRAGVQPPVDLLLKIAGAFGRIATQRDAKRLEIFLRKNPARMRFVACELCEHGLWENAISVIENSRVLLYSKHAQESRECDLPSTDPSEGNSWVYVTHSPKGTYVILGPEDEDGSASGIILADVDGAKLSELHFSFADESVGLMHAQAGGMSSHLTAATRRAFDILEPVSDAIRGLVPEGRGICLVIGGLYVTLPVSAALTKDYPARYRYVVIVPSRTHTVCRRYSLALNEKVVATAMSAQAAPWVPEMPILAYPNREVLAFERMWSATGAQTSVVTQARTTDFDAAFPQCNLVLFSGHSMGMPHEPECASMLFQDGPYSVSMILEHPPVRNLLLATISSCQSGHQSTTVLADEFLGINMALLNRGCRFTLSTLWPIFDVVSYVVTSRFYYEMTRESDMHIESLYRCLTDTQLWIRTSTAAEIAEYFSTNNLEIPTVLAPMAADSIPFAHPRVWAAYYLSARCL